ncbi:E3 ubiquitin-protein ligase TRIM32-like [Branchiostoma floridae x Branchiostoma japonicum]
MAAAGGSNAAHQRMRGQEFLVCGICLDHFTLPKILPCAHTFCQACLETYAGRRRFIYCPNCRRVAELDSASGVRGLPGNFWVTNLRDVIAERDSENPDVKGRLQGNRCKLHPGEQCRHFCQDCHVPVCGECLFSEHNGHALERLERVLSEVRQELRKCLEIAQQIAGELKMVLHEFESRREGKNKIEQPETPDEEAETERQRIDWADAMLNRLLKAFKFSRRAAELYDYGGLQRCKKLLADLINQVGYRMDHFPQLFHRNTTLAGEIADAALLRHGTVAIAIGSNVHVLDDQAQEIFHFRASDFSPVENMCINEQNGDILVSLWPENVIKVFDLRGKLKLQFGCYGNADGQLDQPKGLCVDPEGRILVADSGNKRVALFDGSGVFLKNVATEGDGLKEPHALYASRDGKVVVTDIGTHSVHVIEY